jgi:hypothetical protein
MFDEFVSSFNTAGCHLLFRPRITCLTVSECADYGAGSQTVAILRSMSLSSDRHGISTEASSFLFWGTPDVSRLLRERCSQGICVIVLL